MTMPRVRTTLLGLWLALVVLFVVPWGRFQDHAHWQRVVWVPFGNPPLRIGDIVRNTVLYLPLGALLAGHRPAWHITGYALAISTATELTQVFSHGRVPSATDVTTNVLGALAGLAARRAISSIRLRPSPSALRDP
jgi:glycopeptide antibiotics resistance protein